MSLYCIAMIQTVFDCLIRKWQRWTFDLRSQLNVAALNVAISRDSLIAAFECLGIRSNFIISAIQCSQLIMCANRWIKCNSWCVKRSFNLFSLSQGIMNTNVTNARNLHILLILIQFSHYFWFSQLLLSPNSGCLLKYSCANCSFFCLCLLLSIGLTTYLAPRTNADVIRIAQPAIASGDSTRFFLIAWGCICKKWILSPSIFNAENINFSPLFNFPL